SPKGGVRLEFSLARSLSFHAFLSFHPRLRLCRTHIPGPSLASLSPLSLLSDWHVDAVRSLELSKLLPHLILRGAETLF
ncbi:MAG: hypothetical protein ACK55Z_35610, partial [bacterium]